MSIHKEIDDAIFAHQGWVKKIKTTVAFSSRTINTSIENEKRLKMINKVQSDENCRFGKWLYAISGSELKNKAYIKNIKELHIQFHQEAAEILALSLSGKSKEAELKLVEQASFILCSTSLIKKLEEWKFCIDDEFCAECIL